MTTKTYNTPTTTAVEPIKVIADIIMTEMDLKASQIKDAYQLYEIPADGLFVEIGYIGQSEPISSQTYFDSELLTEVQQAVFRHTIRIELMSMAPDNSARIRKEEVALSLRSFYSQQQQDAHNIGIAWLQENITDATELEETAMLNRYITDCFVHALHQKTQTADYFELFPIKLVTDTQGGRETIVDINPTEAPQ